MQRLFLYKVSFEHQQDEYWHKSTCLHVAVLYNHFSVCLALVGYGADLSIRNSDGQAPLDCAIATQNEHIVELLKNVNDEMRRHIKASRLFSEEELFSYRKKQWYTFLIGCRYRHCVVSLLSYDVFGIILTHMKCTEPFNFSFDEWQK
eukprot:c6724_g1_i7.p1 GENE.c6724_g1_i7~~c6724_g1_i7.p1  ORF type:complete len:148 (+),score=21.97 c6724_g1_i7:39-482(+)